MVSKTKKPPHPSAGRMMELLVACGYVGEGLEAEAARAMGITHARLSAWKARGVAKDGPPFFRDGLNANPGWLMYGEGEMFLPGGPKKYDGVSREPWMKLIADQNREIGHLWLALGTLLAAVSGKTPGVIEAFAERLQALPEDGVQRHLQGLLALAATTRTAGGNGPHAAESPRGQTS